MSEAAAALWNDTPPTVAGTYWVKGRTSGEEWPMRLHEDGAFEGHPSEVQFGHRIPTNAELGELPGLIEKYGSCKASEEGWRDGDNIFLYKKACDESDAALAKINAILGVVE